MKKNIKDDEDSKGVLTHIQIFDIKPKKKEAVK